MDAEDLMNKKRRADRSYLITSPIEEVTERILFEKPIKVTVSGDEVAQVGADRKLVICTSFDQNYVPHGTTMLLSALENRSKKTEGCDVVIMTSGIDLYTRNQIRSILEGNGVKVYFVMPKFHMASEDSPILDHPVLPQETFYRMVLPSCLKNADRLLYLDSDIIVTGDIDELFGMDLDKGSYLGAIRDYPSMACVENSDRISAERFPDFEYKDYFENHLSFEKSFNWRKKYFNAGVVLMDCQAIRRDHLEVDFLEKSSTKFYVFGDQDVLNQVLADKITILHFKWNFIVAICRQNIENLEKTELSEINEGMAHPHVLHYAGTKPWQSSDVPCGKWYWLYLARTPFFEKVLSDFNTESRKRLMNDVKREIVEVKSEIADLRNQINHLLGEIIARENRIIEDIRQFSEEQRSKINEIIELQGNLFKIIKARNQKGPSRLRQLFRHPKAWIRETFGLREKADVTRFTHLKNGYVDERQLVPLTISWLIRQPRKGLILFARQPRKTFRFMIRHPKKFLFSAKIRRVDTLLNEYDATAPLAISRDIFLMTDLIGKISKK
ncbi:MAG: glycosyltransferase family 8 protein [Luteolibacter sp.]